MGLLQEILEEARGPSVGDSAIIAVIDKNKKLTDKLGGPIRLSIVRNKQIAMALDNAEGKREDFIQASITKGKDGGLAWNVKAGEGIAKFKLKKVSDDEMRAVVQRIFDKAKKQK
jgi:hypothetical protein